MMTDWTWTQIKDIAETFDGPHATPESSKTATSGPIFLGISSLYSGRLDFKQSAFMSENDFAIWTRRVTPRKDDVVFSYETRLGEAAIIPADFRGSLGRRLALMRPDTSKVDPRFLLYYYLGPTFQKVIRRNTVQGSTVDRIMLREFPNFPVELPPLDEQRSIAATLGALDDKIESNRRAVELANQLLDSTVEHVSLTLPSVPLSELVTVTRQTIDPTKLGCEIVDHYSLPAFDDGVWPERVPAQSVMSSKLVVRQSSILVSRLNPRFNRTWWAVPEEGITVLASTEFSCLTSASPIELAAAWLAVRDNYFREELRRRVTGTSGSHQRIRPDDMLAIEVPDTRLLDGGKKSEALCLLELVHLRRREIVALSSLRDTLLPELLSGCLRVGDGAAP